MDAAQRMARLRSAWAGWPGLLARCALGLFPLAWLVGHIDAGRLSGRAAALGVMPFSAALALLIGSYGLSAWRWSLLLREWGGATPPLARLWRFNLESCYFSLVPSGLLGEALRGHRLRHAVGVSESYSIVLLERLIGLIALLGIAAFALLAAPELGGNRVPPELSGSVLALFLVAAGLLLGVTFLDGTALQATLRRWPRLEAAVLPLLRPRARPVLARVFVLSLAVQFSVILCIWVLARQVHPSATLGACLGLVPLILIGVFIPVTPAALGQREAAFVYFFGFIGVDPGAAIVLSLSVFAVGLATALIGAGLHLIGVWSERQSPAARLDPGKR